MYLSVFLIIIIIIIIMLNRSGQEGFQSEPNPLAEDDILVILEKMNSNGTNFQIKIISNQNHTIYHFDTFVYYYNVYDSYGSEIDSWLMEGFFRYNNSEAVVVRPLGHTYILNETIDTDDFPPGTYYVSIDVHITDYYDSVVIYSSDRMDFMI